MHLLIGNRINYALMIADLMTEQQVLHQHHKLLFVSSESYYTFILCLKVPCRIRDVFALDIMHTYVICRYIIIP
jgi:hypothetical protein